ncbi:NAD-dependent DNA ligase LigA [Fluviispira multicolorata]|uniref:NAD-dependent DNA ligase LigA n=1 Tax=Fluviispira multicolorata TaxID=2654512 RepID=UPI001375FF7C|nr:NAD-dependent DNA ligase LigA [Fluviispira multicolorata]
MITKKNIKIEIENIASQILYHKKLYYKGKSIISDAEYDALEQKLKELAPNHPVLSLVGYPFSETNNKISHNLPMLSLAKTYSIEDLFEFINKYECVAMDKIDGMALSIEYDENGNFLRASTRGNGKFGEDVTEHVYHIKDISKKIILNSSGKYKIEIRGEVYFPLSEFPKFTDRFDSFRNAVPGTLGRKDVEEAVDVLRVLKFCVYDILVFDKDDNYIPARNFSKIFSIESDYFEKINILESLSFITETSHISEINNIKNVENLTTFLKELYSIERDYQIDGIVFRLRDEIIWESLGNTAHHPRGSLAFKQAGETAETEIQAIEVNVGRSGKISFRAKLNPVYLSGAKISYATLHNAEFIEQGEYAVGAKVEIIRSGEVIPAILRLVEPAEKKFKLPSICLCGSLLTRKGPDLLCLDNKNCTFKDQESLVYYVSSLDIMGVSDKIIMKIREAGLVQEPADFYKLNVEDLLQIEGFAQKSSENVVAAIQASRQIPLAKFLTSLGLKRGGAVKCQEVAKKCGTLNNTLKLSVEDLLSEKGWAQKSAEDFVESLKNKEHVIENLLKFVTVLNDDSGIITDQQKNHPYFGKNICITGALSRPREEYKAMLEKAGAKLVSSVSSKTDFLVCNETSSSSKYKDAIKHNVQILSEVEFSDKL